MKIELVVHNQSDYAMTGNASIEWKELSKYGLTPEHLLLRDNTGCRLHAQLDSRESITPQRLHFSLNKEVNPKESYNSRKHKR
jgi:hypothetical protein